MVEAFTPARESRDIMIVVPTFNGESTGREELGNFVAKESRPQSAAAGIHQRADAGVKISGAEI
jgi:hypothetical protein